MQVGLGLIIRARISSSPILKENTKTDCMTLKELVLNNQSLELDWLTLISQATWNMEKYPQRQGQLIIAIVLYLASGIIICIDTQGRHTMIPLITVLLID